MKEEDLKLLSFYAFWRMFTNNKQKLVQRRREKIVAVNGTGWPAQAKTTHVHHLDYARRTLYAYMPCAGLRGTDYIDDVVRDTFSHDWAAALLAFVKDPLQKWCPTWIKRNYETLNETDLLKCWTKSTSVLSRNLRITWQFDPPAAESKEESPPSPTVKLEKDDENDVGADPPGDMARAVTAEESAAAREATAKWNTAEASGEPPAPEDTERPEAYESDHHWNKEHRPPEELHSALGPNLDPEPRRRVVERMQESVNPDKYDWHSAWKDIDVASLHEKWETLRATQPDMTCLLYTSPSPRD